MLGLRARASRTRGECTVLMITHKFREVTAYADDVTRAAARHAWCASATRGRRPTPAQLARDDGRRARGRARVAEGRAAARAPTDAGGADRAAGRRPAVARRPRRRSRCTASSLAVRARRDRRHRRRLRQRPARAGRGAGRPARRASRQRARDRASPTPPTRAQNRAPASVRSLPEEPLRNACVGELSVARQHGAARLRPRRRSARGGWLRFGACARARARAGSPSTASRRSGENAPIAHAVGRQRAARRAGARARRRRRRADRRQPGVRPRLRRGAPRSTPASCRCAQRGAAVLLVSEDLDELLELSDRIVVMSEGRIVLRDAGGRGRPAHDRRAHGRRAHHGTRRPRTAAGVSARTRRPRPHDRRRRTRDAVRVHASRRAARRSSIIDMQRDFVEPGGFGASLGNDVTRLHAGDRADRRAARGLARARLAGRAHARVPPARPVGLPAGQARSAATPSLRIGDPGPMGRVLIAGEPGADIIPALAPQRRRDRHRQARQGHVLGHRPARDAAGARHHAPGLHRRDDRGLRADDDARGQRPRLRLPAASRTAPRATSRSSRRQRSR